MFARVLIPGPIVVLLCVILRPVDLGGTGNNGFRVPDGFEVSLFAGDDLAHDIHSMTTDHEGRIVVASRGWVKILHDTDGDGKADQARTFSEFPKSGAQGMYFDEEGLVVSGDRGIRRWRDADGDGEVDGEPLLLFRTAEDGEHGAHGIVKGPDGWFYIIVGNKAIPSEHAPFSSNSPVKRVTAGAMVRFLPDGTASEVLAHGFRNAYDFDFHPLGHILTFDSDGERDYHLPWYAGTRIFDIAVGAEHGWVLKGSPHAWSRPESWFDNTARLWTVGRGSPTGVVVYRHRAFPARYREGVFTLCWTMGRIYFSPLARDGSTFRAGLEIFMEAEGNNGFAPVAAVVGPEGDLFVAIGGRGTTGSVFRVHYAGAGAAAPMMGGNALREVLGADQPLASWSRARWVPQARHLGAAAFDQAASSSGLPLAERIRAVEVLVELFAGLRSETARQLIGSGEPELVARVAWALTRSGNIPDPFELLAELTHRDDPRVARAAWEALQSLTTGGSAARPLASEPDWFRGLASGDRRVRAAAVLAARGAGFSSFAVTPLPSDATERQRLGQLKVFGAERRNAPGWTAYFFETCISIFKHSTQPDIRRDAIRLLQIGFGDVSPVEHRPETYGGFVGAKTSEIPAALRAHVVTQLAPAFPTGEAELDREIARVLAMLAADAPGLLQRIGAMFSDVTTVEDDIYYLMVAARLEGLRCHDTTRRIARAAAGLHHKMIAGKKAPSRFWGTHVGDTFARLLARDPALAAALVDAPNFNRPEHALFAAMLPEDEKNAAVLALLARSKPSGDEGTVLDQPADSWTEEFVDLLTVLPDATVFPALRGAWSNASLRDSITISLARSPQREDRDRFVAGLGSFQPPVVEHAARALLKISGGASAPEVAVALASLRRHCRLRHEKPVREALVKLLTAWTGQRFDVIESSDLLLSYAPWFEWFTKRHPAAGMRFFDRDEDWEAWVKRLDVVNWDAGNAERGRTIYNERLCSSCHDGGGTGPHLVGITTRLSRADLFAKVFDPSRDISPAWRGTQFTTRDGTVYNGVVVHESPSATLIRMGLGTTVRLLGDDVVSVQPSRTSPMPPGLLNGLKDDDIADFYAYLKTLKK